ncbi:hypothetical protein AB0E08_22340 [Streptomyces sp. NPDC048281]|uniref:hypothetical protein n=1 Tax=Streptomyces sp. NPDC048281 TaxID=3154715 RepID=UPI0034417F42
MRIPHRGRADRSAAGRPGRGRGGRAGPAEELWQALVAEEIVRDLQAALNEFTAIARSLGGEVDVPEAEVE